MNYADIFIQVMSEFTGNPRHEVGEMLGNFRRVNPGGKWDKEIPPENVEGLLANLRREVPGIIPWFIRGAKNGSMVT